MKLQLYIRQRLLFEEEIFPSVIKNLNDKKLNHETIEKFIGYAVAGLKNKYAKAIENSEWEIYLVSESRINEYFMMEDL